MNTWIVVRTFNRQELTVGEFLKAEGLTCFIPMHYVERISDSNRRLHRILMPVIHNYVFIEKTLPVQELATTLSRCRIPVYLLKAHESDQPVEIAEREMAEFRMLCDPAFGQVVEVVAHGEDAVVGKDVEIIHGPFTGVRGRLYRKQKHYWFIKTVAGVSVRLPITRWYCRPI